MRRLSLLLVVIALSILAVAYAQKPPAENMIREISLERSPCFGTCPVYKLTLRSDGTAVYEGTRFVDRQGTYQGKFWGEQFRKLSSQLGKQGFWKLKKNYSVAYTDQATQTVTVTTTKGKTVVSEYGPSGPEQLWAIQTMIDGVGANIKGWEKVEK